MGLLNPQFQNYCNLILILKSIGSQYLGRPRILTITFDTEIKGSQKCRWLPSHDATQAGSIWPVTTDIYYMSLIQRQILALAAKPDSARTSNQPFLIKYTLWWPVTCHKTSSIFKWYEHFGYVNKSCNFHFPVYITVGTSENFSVMLSWDISVLCLSFKFISSQLSTTTTLRGFLSSMRFRKASCPPVQRPDFPAVLCSLPVLP